MLAGWLEFDEPSFDDEFGPIPEAILPQIRRARLSDTELRAFTRRPSKVKRLVWGMEAIVLGNWELFKEWRLGNSEGAAKYRDLEFHILFGVVLVLLALICISLSKPGVGR